MERERLLSISIELPDFSSAVEGQLKIDELKTLLTQAAAAGGKTVALFDHPTTPWQPLEALIDHAQQQGLAVEWFTQGRGIDAQAAAALHQRGVTVALRIDTLDPTLQNTLAGDENAHATIHRALKHLLDAGYGHAEKQINDNAASPILAASISLCPANFAALPELWRWLRKQHIKPWLQLVSPDRLATHSPYLLNPTSVQKSFDDLREIDQREFNITWAIPAGTSVRANSRPLRGCHVTPNGDVLPCAGLGLCIGNVRENTIGDILLQSEILENLRLFASKLKSPCRDHVHEPAQLCCRATAWQLTGDYLATDPLCPHAQGVEIAKLPTSIVGLIPHGPSMRTIDTLVQIIERHSTTLWTIPADSPLVNAQGLLDDAAYVECIAQSFAASHGYHLSPEERKHHRGLLLGVKNYIIHDDAHPGDTLTIITHRYGRFANFGIVHGKVYHADGRLIAEGEVKIWRPPDDEDTQSLLPG